MFHPSELSHNIRNLWSDIHKKHALKKVSEGDYVTAKKLILKALEYPEQFQLGKPLRRFDAKTLYIAGAIFEASDDKANAEKYFREAASEDQPDPTIVKPWSIIAQKKIGQEKLADIRLKELKQKTELYYESSFQPDIASDLKEILNLCKLVKENQLPDIEFFVADEC